MGDYIMFYVYQYLRDDSTPYYIGKGKGKRAWQPHFRSNNANMMPTDKNKIAIIKDNLTEDEANLLEITLIEKYGRKDLGTGILTNLTNGGEGVSGSKRPQSAIDTQRTKITGVKRSKEVIEKISKANTGKKRSTETKRKLSESHKGIKQSAETKRKRAEKLKGIVRSEELKKQWSESKKGKNNPMFGKESSRKGKTYEEIYGVEKAKELKENLRLKTSR